MNNDTIAVLAAVVGLGFAAFAFGIALARAGRGRRSQDVASPPHNGPETLADPTQLPLLLQGFRPPGTSTGQKPSPSTGQVM